ncbi:MAG: alpha/beta hydrolase [Desulfobacterales bacterium CG23_combo_of_CG06-09_8_20_14_all_51_8]|nr:MAG: alpha/beta hydrolase [Desulfobacterales bacterium CG23_combo_of_CG06-09_8_20_14_all_51_8]
MKSGFDIEEGETRIFARGSRKLAWMASGDPAGFPVFFAHGCPGSRLEVAFLADQARNQGFRIIGFDRPGFGRSDFVDGYGLRSFAEDLNALADDLDIKKFGLIGWSSGGPPVLSTAFHMPERAVFVFSLSGYTDFGKFEDAKQLMADYNLYGPALSDHFPRLFDRMLQVMDWTDRHLPNFYLKLAKEEMRAPDRRILDDPETAEHFLRDQIEAMVSGSDGVIQDLNTEWAPWDFDLAQIKIPAAVFQGEQDVFVPWQFARHLSENMPHAALKLYEDKGHLLILDPSVQDNLFRLAKKAVKNAVKE